MFSRLLFFSKAIASESLELHRYTDTKEGFTLLVPSSWIKADKAGATVLFEDASKKANNVGVVVSPTRISTLAEFGTPQFVADKLIQAERRKVCRFIEQNVVIIPCNRGMKKGKQHQRSSSIAKKYRKQVTGWNFIWEVMSGLGDVRNELISYKEKNSKI